MSGEAHVRIDEGIPRGKRIRPLPAKRRKAVLPACNSKLAHLDATKVIQQYLEDRTTAEIAKRAGVHRSGLHQWLLRNCEEQWREAQIARALSAHEEAKDNLSVANDALSLARAREALRSAQWELERLFSRLYGPKQEVTHTGTVTVTNALQAISERRQGQIGSDADGHAAAHSPNIIDVTPERAA